MKQASTIMLDIVTGPAASEGLETRIEAQVHSVQGESTDTDVDADRLLQGEVAPLLTKKEQESMSRQSVFSGSNPCCGRCVCYSTGTGDKTKRRRYPYIKN